MGAVEGGIAGLLILAVFGAIIGWLASIIVKGSGSGLLTDIIVGIAGSWLAGFALPRMGISIGGGWIGAIIAATAGAVVLLLLIRLIRRA